MLFSRRNQDAVLNRRRKQVAAERRRKWLHFIAKGKSVCSKRTSHNLVFIIHKSVVTLTDARSLHLCLLSLLVLRIFQIKCLLIDETCPHLVLNHHLRISSLLISLDRLCESLSKSYKCARKSARKHVKMYTHIFCKHSAL